MSELSPVLKQATPVTVDRGEGCYLYGTDGQIGTGLSMASSTSRAIAMRMLSLPARRQMDS